MCSTFCFRCWTTGGSPTPRGEKQLTVELTQAAKDYVVDSGYDPVYGARPLRRFLQSKVETAIAKAIISRDLRPRTHLVVDYNGRELTVEPVTIMPREG